MAVDWKQIKKLREKRAKLVADAEKIITTAAEETRDLSQDESQKFDAIHAEADTLKAQIERHERQWDAERALSDRAELRDELGDEGAGTPGNDPGKQRTPEQQAERAEELREQAFEQFMRGGQENVDPQLMQELQKLAQENRDLNTGTDNKGGYVIPSQTNQNIVVVMKEIDAVRRAGAVVIPDTISGPYELPYVDDTANGGDISDEGTADSDADPTFGAANLQDYRFDSDAIPVSEQMLMRGNLETLIYRLLAERIAQKQQAMFTVGAGSGSSQPKGIFVAASIGKTATANNAITYGEIIDLMYSVKQSYRSQASCGWMLKDTTMAAIRKIVDNDGRPIFSVSTTQGTPDMILGKPVTENDSAPAIGASNKPIAFGLFSKYVIRDVRGVRIKRDPFTRANKDQVVFHGFQNSGGDLSDPNAIKTLQMAA